MANEMAHYAAVSTDIRYPGAEYVIGLLGL